MVHSIALTGFHVAAGVVLTLLVGCSTTDPTAAFTIQQAVEQRAENHSSQGTYQPRARSPHSGSGPIADEPVAVVNGRPIDRDPFVRFLVQSRGVDVLEELVGLAVVERHAEKLGISIGEDDLRFEEDLALRRLVDPLAASSSFEFDRAEAEKVLGAVLAGRSMSRDEYMVTIHRNAWLRKTVAAQLDITDEQLQTEYALLCGPRVQVRHIQLPTLADASMIRERLAGGERFAELATRYSANAISARRGGLLEPFSLADEDIPPALRSAAAELDVGETSDVVRVGEWFQILRLERRLPAESRDWEALRETLRRRILVRRSEAPMRKLYETLVRGATVEVRDPTLRDIAKAAHPEWNR